MQDQQVKKERPQIAVLAIVAWPLSMLLAALAQPKIGDAASDVYSAAVGGAGRIALSAAIGIPGIVLWLITVAIITRAIRGKGSTLAKFGGVFAIFGALGHMANATLFLVLLGIPKAGDEATLTLAVDRIAKHVFPVAMPMLFLGAIGVFLLGLSLYRNGIASKITPILLGLSIVAEFIPFPGVTGDVVTWALVGVGLGLSLKGIRAKSANL